MSNVTHCSPMGLRGRTSVLIGFLLSISLVSAPVWAEPTGDSLFPPMIVAPPSASPAVRGVAPVTPGPPLRPPDTAWIEATLASMTLDEKIGQMIMPGYTSVNAAKGLLNAYHIGGFIFQGNSNSAPAVLTATNALQAVADVPLLFSTDCEAGLGARFSDATRFPLNMGNAAAYDLELTRQQGAVTARECRAIGIQIGFGPVVDVNTEPINPIIGIRSYSDNPSSVTALARAYMQGANSEGLLCTPKHFPGHGASTGDSHFGLPTINISLADLQADHVSPYAQLLGEGLGDLVMTAHVWYPALDPGPTAWPATLSTPALTGILRNQLQYDGCVITDSFAMGGLLDATTTYDGVKIAVLAGVDIILTPASTADAFNGLRDAVLVTHEITEAQINQSVRRILALKSRAGMPEITIMPTAGLATVAHPANLAVAEQIGRKAIAANLEGSVIPVQPTESVAIYVLNTSSGIFYSYPPTVFTDAFHSAHAASQVFSVSNSPSGQARANMVSQAQNFDKVLLVNVDRQPNLFYPSQATLVNEMLSANIPLAYISFSSPYQWSQFPALKNFLCGFSSHYATQQEMVRVVTGQSIPGNNWPVQLTQVVSAVNDWALY